MRWKKAGLIYDARDRSEWQRHSFMTPTPILLSDEVIRVYGGFRDGEGVSRIGYIDVSARDPSRVLQVSPRPVLDVGEPGMFDDNGVILGDVVRDAEVIRMYYVGFQQVRKAKFLAFSGCAVSHDGGGSFVRVTATPVMERSAEGPYIRAIHTAARHEGRWRVWYSAGDGWETIGGTQYPRYHIRCCDCADGLLFPAAGRLCLLPGNGEYRIGRPRVYQLDGRYVMFFTSDNSAKEYRAGAAVSDDGFEWRRDDTVLGIGPSKSGWDSEMLCYPALLRAGAATYLFYSGNGMGRTGVGFAALEGATSMTVEIAVYREADEPEWNAFVESSKNGTFLFDRRFMGYHADRFQDHSLLLRAEGRLIATFPASVSADTVASHAGLSYGGLVTDGRMQAGVMLGVMEGVIEHYRSLGLRNLVYKAVPHIYHRHPAEEDAYALFRAGAQVSRVDISTTIDLAAPLPLSKGRKHGLSKARRAGVAVQKSDDYARFWPLLEQVLGRHDAAPVHSLAEITLLAGRFPENIALYTGEIQGAVAAGCVMFVAHRVAHVQYMAASDDGRENGALDAVVHHLMTDIYRDKRYFDFGHSTEDEGRVLNEGLCRHKEAFGGSATACFYYKVPL